MSDWEKRVVLPDGRVVEYVWAEDGGEALDHGDGYRRLYVTVAVDGELARLPVVLSSEDIAAAGPAA